jgi:hypothetical protein
VKSGAGAGTCDASIGGPVSNNLGAAPFARAGADQFALGKPAVHGQHQAPVTIRMANVVAICFAAFQWGG